MADNQQHVNYTGADQKIHELWYSDNGGWQYNVLTDLAGVSDNNSLPGSRSATDGYATPWNNQQHMNYIGNDGKVHELWYPGSGGWSHNVLNDLAGAGDFDSLPGFGSFLDGYATPWNNQQHVNYIGNDGKIHELWYSDNGGWRHNVLNDLAGADSLESLPTSNSGLDGYATPWNNQQHVNYIDSVGKIHELWYSDSGGWNHNVLSDLANATDNSSLPASGSALDGYPTPWNGQQHVNYIGNDGKVHELWYSDGGGWNHNVLSDLAGAGNHKSLPYTLFYTLDGYATPWNNQQHVNYVGNDLKVHELWYSDNGGWSHNVLSDLAGASSQDLLTRPVPFSSPLDGYATPWNNQQHVNYIGNDGKVHELWYSDSGGWKHNILNDLANASDQYSVPAIGSGLDGYVT